VQKRAQGRVVCRRRVERGNEILPRGVVEHEAAPVGQGGRGGLQAATEQEFGKGLIGGYAAWASVRLAACVIRRSTRSDPVCAALPMADGV